MAVEDDLARFNAFVANEAEQEKQGRRVKRAEQAKEKAAAEVRRLDGDSRATVEQKAEAKQAYLDATEAWRREVSGEGPDDPTPADVETADETETPAEGEASPEAEVSDDATSGEGEATETVEAEAGAEDTPGDDAPTEGDAEA